MAVRDLLVYVERCGDNVAVDVAATLACRDRAHLTGVFPVPSFRPPPGCEDAVFELVREKWCRDAEDAIKRARQLFEERTSQAGQAGGWLAAPEGVAFAKSLSRYVDLVVIGRGALDAPAGTVVTAEDIAMEVGRPVLIVSDGASSSVGSNVVLAWKPTRQAARAMADALPVLAPGARVTILLVHPYDEALRQLDDDVMASHLRRHGLDVSIEPLWAAESEVVPTLLQRASELAADMMIAGAYGRSQLRERLLGGVTHALLRATRLPVLMSH
jgi:nucleotide-binding universal stress UspA family protein